MPGGDAGFAFTAAGASQSPKPARPLPGAGWPVPEPGGQVCERGRQLPQLAGVAPFCVDVISLSPAAVVDALADGLVGRAVRQGRVRLRVWQLREFSRDPHRKVDDLPYGGGQGMVIMAEPLVLAAEHALLAAGRRSTVVLLSAGGEPFTQQLARELARGEGLVVLCGRYEGVDARVAPALGAREVSLGEYVLSSGEPAACCLVDAVVRLLPGVVGNPASVVEESFGSAGTSTAGLLEYPHYTRPRLFRGMAVPEVLLSGHHAAIARWRREQSLRLTWERRPELLQRASLTAEERRLVEQWSKQKFSGQLSEPSAP